MGYFLSELAYIIYAVSPKDGPLPYPGMPVIFSLLSLLSLKYYKYLQFHLTIYIFKEYSR